MAYFDSVQDFNALSVTDLLSAREQFHLHLMNKPNVVGTAIGRYRIRKADPWPSKSEPHADAKPRRTHPKRTLENSEVRPYSWPAILVFVERWEDAGSFAHPDQAVPRAVYMPNGQRVPICIIESTQAERVDEGATRALFPASLMGGGYPVLADVQGREHIASVGCLVTDGHRMFALTNRHVAGEAGETIYSMLAGNKTPIGTSTSKSETRVPFEVVYPGWPGQTTYVNLDVGLVEVDEVDRWTTQVYGVGEIGALADISTVNLTLRLIGCPVRAHGAAGGDMRGEVCALFYRFKSVGGFDYVSDLLIGPREALALGTRPGDSGTLWMVDDPGSTEDRSCLALQWGGQTFGESGQSTGSSYALATFVSTICGRLGVDLRRDWNGGNPDYWGAVGHYGIATIAIDALKSKKLGELMRANRERISYDVASINKNTMKGLSKLSFVPLADVPDMVWKVGPHKRGGMKSPEHANHFADMDRELSPPLSEGATLLDICKDRSNVTVKVWQRYYDAVKKQYPDQEESRGLLPFRCWQIYQAMVQYVKAGDVKRFVTAAGILSHYVGDSCQPLHISYLFNGDPDRMVPGRVRDTVNGGTKDGEVPYGTGVHSAYEDDMVDANVATLFKSVEGGVQRVGLPAKLVGGQAAAVAVVQLMQSTFASIAPMDIVNMYAGLTGSKPAERAKALWNKFGSATGSVMADGCLCLAQLWESAWVEGQGDRTIKSLGEIDEAALASIYQEPKFLPSVSLDTIGTVLK